MPTHDRPILCTLVFSEKSLLVVRDACRSRSSAARMVKFACLKPANSNLSIMAVGKFTAFECMLRVHELNEPHRLLTLLDRNANDIHALQRSKILDASTCMRTDSR
jgi:hypothetical protein